MKVVATAAVAVAAGGLLVWYARHRSAASLPSQSAPIDEAEAAGAKVVATPSVRRPSFVVLHSGDFAHDVGEMIIAGVRERVGVRGKLLHMDGFKRWADELSLGKEGQKDVVVCFIVATIENEQPPESAGACIRFFNRTSNPKGMLARGSAPLQFTVLGLGDSNLLLDRQTTTAKDCNQVAQKLDARLEELGGRRFYPRGEVDDRTGSLELAPWIDGIWDPLCNVLQN
ncbi:hypothetical protein AB1Y20_006546 [Prymnesium parvum]|uniref:Flavodoxin-like domain-containing protein n=1 Tax=Prymnesium parvum TaxID=97485 RepID=A0AB34J0J0_PRYPA